MFEQLLLQLLKGERSMNIIEDFYYGNTEPQNYSPEYEKRLRSMQNKLSETEEKLRNTLTADEDKVFSGYVNLFYENHKSCSFF